MKLAWMLARCNCIRSKLRALHVSAAALQEICWVSVLTVDLGSDWWLFRVQVTRVEELAADADVYVVDKYVSLPVKER